MQAPSYREVNGRRYCSATVRYLVEYELWRAGAMQLADLLTAIKDAHETTVRKSYAADALALLISAGRVERIAHGVYLHKDSPFA